jgi:hypothetical protein
MTQKVKLVNLTPHALNFVQDDGGFTVEPSGIVARCVENAEPRGEINGVPVVAKTFGAVENLPAAEDGKAYVVSALAAQAAWAAGRTDVYSVGTPVRNTDGQIVGCRGLCCAP